MVSKYKVIKQCVTSQMRTNSIFTEEVRFSLHILNILQYLVCPLQPPLLMKCLLLLCSHSPNDVPPVPQRNVSIAAERGAVHPSMMKCLSNLLLYKLT